MGKMGIYLHVISRGICEPHLNGDAFLCAALGVRHVPQRVQLDHRPSERLELALHHEPVLARGHRGLCGEGVYENTGYGYG